MENLPYELIETVIKHISPRHQLQYVNSSKMTRLFEYLLRFYRMYHNFWNINIDKLCIVSMIMTKYNKIVSAIDENVRIDESQIKCQMNNLRYLMMTKHFTDLDMSKFSSLRKYQSNVYIKIPKNIEVLSISFTKNHLFNNTIKSLDISHVPDIYPKNLIKLKFNKLESLGLISLTLHELGDLSKLPKSLKYLDATYCNISKLSALPPQIVEIIFGDDFNVELPELPHTLTKIHLSSNFKKSFTPIIESNIEYLSIKVIDDGGFNLITSVHSDHPIFFNSDLLSKLTKIKTFKLNDTHITMPKIKTLPPNVKKCIFCTNGTKMNIIDYPASLIYLKMNQTHKSPPKSLRYLTINDSDMILPDNLISLTINYYKFHYKQKFPLSLERLSIRSSLGMKHFPLNFDYLINLKSCDIFSISGTISGENFPKQLKKLSLCCFGQLLLKIDYLYQLEYLKTNCDFELLPKSIRYLTCNQAMMTKIPKWVKYISIKN